MNAPRNARLLVVDDEVAQMEALRDTLQDQGYEVVGRSSGEAGLSALHDAGFDVLLADLMMPGMDGIDLLRAALSVDPTLMVIIMTGAGTIESAVQAMQSGALDYILKPFKLSAIIPVLERALTVRQLRLENVLLQRRVLERTAELEEANVELEAFSRTVSHDLRSPLNAVVGFSDLLLKKHCDVLPAQAQTWLGLIHRSGQKMNKLIEDLLRLAHAGRRPLQLETIDLGDMVKEVVTEINELGPQETTLFVVEPMGTVVADPPLLRQVLVNLLSNARKFSAKTAVPRVEIGQQVVGDETICFVRDNGVGFDMASSERLFGTFERLHSDAEFEGTGIGLSTVKRIIQRHGGRVWAESRSGSGATFFFTIPPVASAANPGKLQENL